MDDELIISVEKKNENTNKKRKSNKKKVANAKTKAASNAAKNKKTSSNKIRSISEKRKEEKKKKRFPKIVILLIIFLIILLCLVSGIFNITQIEVEGNEKVSSEEIISLSKIENYTNIFRFSKSEVINNIKTNAYIENVKITRKFPNTVYIEIEERTINYMLQFADSFVYINNQGYMLEISNEKQNVPIIIGITTDLSNIQAGNRMDTEDLSKMNTVIEIYETAKRNGISDLITKIDISDSDNYTLILETEGKTVYLGDATEELNTKMLYLKDILEYEAGNSGEVFLNVNLSEERVRFREST